MEGKFFSSFPPSFCQFVSKNLLFSLGNLVDDYFTLDHDWSLLSFLLYRQQYNDFSADKCKEHKRYIRNLANIINCEQASEIAIKRAEVALASLQVAYFSFFVSSG